MSIQFKPYSYYVAYTLYGSIDINLLKISIFPIEISFSYKPSFGQYEYNIKYRPIILRVMEWQLHT